MAGNTTPSTAVRDFAYPSGPTLSLYPVTAHEVQARRSTVSITPKAPVSRISNDFACTHMTMTRLYTKEFTCALCMEYPSMGWLYRCTQDRELLVEDDWERNRHDQWDAIPDIFERSSAPRPGTPDARLSKTAFLDETTEEYRKETYSADQIHTILNQRAHLIDVCSTAHKTHLETNPYGYLEGLGIVDPAIGNTQKPWLPLRGGECQYKCCHRCRPSSEARSYLSIAGIANGNIPPLTVMGFGFHLNRDRPIAKAHHTQNLGLRPNPPSRNLIPQTWSHSARTLPDLPYRRSPHKRNHSALQGPTVGLGIGTARETTLPPQKEFQEATAAVSEPYQRPNSPTPTRSRASPLRLRRISTPIATSCGAPTSPPSPSASLKSTASQEPATPTESNLENTGGGTPVRRPLPSSSNASTFKDDPILLIPLPHQSVEEKLFLETGVWPTLPVPNCPSLSSMRILQPPSTGVRNSYYTENWEHEDDKENGTDGETGIGEAVAGAGVKDMTAMEEDEMQHNGRGGFHKEALNVKGGVAVLEESLECHVPDIITQF